MEFKEIIESLRAIKTGIYSRKKSNALRFGTHQSSFKGAGYNIEQVTEWREGEPLKNIAWNLSIRTYPDKLFIVQKIEEREVPHLILADISPSMLVGVKDRQNKLRMLLELVGFIGFTCVRVQDPVGIIGFSDRVNFYLRPRASNRAVFYMIKLLFDKAFTSKAAFHKSEAAFDHVLDFLNRRLRRRHTIILISDMIDFLNDDQLIRKSLWRGLAADHDILVLILDDPDEFAFGSKTGSLRLKDIESGKSVIFSLRNTKKLRELVISRQEALIAGFRALGIEAAVLNYGQHLVRFESFLMARRARK